MNTKLKSSTGKNALACFTLSENKVVFPIKNCIVLGQGLAISYVAEQISEYLKSRNK